MRHGQAETLAVSDATRKLTEFGHQQVFAMSSQMAERASFDVILSSTYLRAMQTATIMAQPHSVKLTGEYRDFVPEAEPFSAALFIKSLIEAHPQHETWLIVAHMPLVSYLIAEFCPPDMPIFATAAACEIDYDETTEQATLTQMHLPAMMETIK